MNENMDIICEDCKFIKACDKEKKCIIYILKALGWLDD